MAAKRYFTFGQGGSDLEGHLKPVVRIMGIGGAGCNMVNSVLDLNLRHVGVIAVNTDAQNLHGLSCTRILIGKTLTSGRGACSDPQIGEDAAIADIDKIRGAIAGTDVLFIVLGLGGGTGTGASPVVANLAREMGIFVVALTIYPFRTEGTTRNQRARFGVDRLKDAADVVVMVQNDKLVEDFPEMRFQDAIKVADHLLLAPVRSITQLLTKEDLPNLRKVLSIRDIARLGFGESSLKLEPHGAVKDAIDSLMPDGDISSHDRALAVISCPPGCREDDLHRLIQHLHLFIHEDADIMWGPIVDPSLDDEIRLMTIVGRSRACSLEAALPMTGAPEPDIHEKTGEPVSR
jgi:cell division protein FtsZ